jgi:acetoin utilization deacetylase AcuC-like enzyme
MCADDPRVFTLSVHCESNFPARKQRSDLDVGLPDGTGDAAYLGAVGDALSSTLASFKPDLVLYDAGESVD